MDEEKIPNKLLGWLPQYTIGLPTAPSEDEVETK